MGFLISLEGGEYVGKSAVGREGLITLLNEAGIPVQRGHEPGGSPIAERIRAILLDSAYYSEDQILHPVVDLYLFNAARRLNLDNTIGPFLRENPNGVLVLDRFVDSTMVYQGIGEHRGQGMDPATILDIHRICTTGYEGNPFPDLTYILHIPEEHYESVLRTRSKGIRAEISSWDTQGYEHHLARQRAYMSLPDIYREHNILREFRFIDSSVKASEVMQQVAEAQQLFFDERGVAVDLYGAYERMRAEGFWREMDAKWVDPKEQGQEGRLPAQARR